MVMAHKGKVNWETGFMTVADWAVEGQGKEQQRGSTPGVISELHIRTPGPP